MTPEQWVAMIRCPTVGEHNHVQCIANALSDVATVEREACAKIAELSSYGCCNIGEDIAEDIRARGQASPPVVST